MWAKLTPMGCNHQLELGATYVPVCGAFFLLVDLYWRVIKPMCSAYTIWDNHPMYKNNNSNVIWMFHFSSMCVFFSLRFDKTLCILGIISPHGPRSL